MQTAVNPSTKKSQRPISSSMTGKDEIVGHTAVTGQQYEVASDIERKFCGTPLSGDKDRHGT
jgi:hypothetical protein